MKLLKLIAEAILDIPARIVYTIQNWVYVDWRIQTAVYIIAIMIMVGALSVVLSSSNN